MEGGLYILNVKPWLKGRLQSITLNGTYSLNTNKMVASLLLHIFNWLCVQLFMRKTPKLTLECNSTTAGIKIHWLVIYNSKKNFKCLQKQIEQPIILVKKEN